MNVTHPSRRTELMIVNNFNQVPQSTEAEQSVIGSILIDPQSDKSQTVLSHLSPDAFYQRTHREIFKVMREMNNSGQPIDLITITNRLEEMGTLKELGGFAYLAEINHGTPSAANILAYAKTIREKSAERQMIERTAEIQRMFMEPSTQSLEEKIEIAQVMLGQVAEASKSGKSTGLVNISDVIDDWFNETESRINNPERYAGLKTGIQSFDEMLAPKGIVGGSLFVIGARPKMGKTTVLSEMAKNVARDGKHVALFTMEMTNKQIVERMISQKSNVNTDIFYGSDSDEYEWALVGQAISEMKDNPNIWLNDAPAMTLAHIQSEARKLKRKVGKIGFIGVDYLTLMKAGKADRNDIAYGEITKGLKILAKELDTVVVLLIQLNRKLEDRANKRPMPSDGRDTGQIEQDCDYWMAVHRESVFDDKADPTLTELILRLNRHGKTGTAYVEQRGLTLFDIDQIQGAMRAEPKRENMRKKDF